MENRLFLLDAPEELVPTGLTANILAGVDVTPESEYSGKITLTQLNAYSGELKAEALTNFKTIKIEKDGSESFTNVAKLLLELQQGGGVEDAIEEAIIVIDSKKGDFQLQQSIDKLRGEMNFLHSEVESYNAGFEERFMIPEEQKGSYWAPSWETADGERSRFMARDIMSKDGESFLVVLNGVIVTGEDGKFVNSEFGPYVIGFDFIVAPSVGDIVEFHGTRTTGKQSSPYEEAVERNTTINDANKVKMENFDSEMAKELANKEVEKTSIIEEIARLQKSLEELDASRNEAYELLVSASSIDDVKKHSEKVKSIDKEISSILGELYGSNTQLRNIDKGIDSIQNDISRETVLYKTLAKEGDTREYQAIVDMFKAIDTEQKPEPAA